MNKLIELRKHHPLFEVLNRNKTINHVKTEKRARIHMMHFLCFLGTHGEGGNNTNSRNRHKQGYGTFDNMRDICVQVTLECMKEKYFYWPDKEETNKMSQHM